MKKRKSQLGYHMMLAPGMMFLILFSFIPMFGIIMAFQDYIPTKGILGSPWVGLDNFKYMLEIPDSMSILKNTLIIAIGKIILITIVPITFVLLLNEIELNGLKKQFKQLCICHISYHGQFWQ